MSRPTALTVAARQAVVRQLIERDPNLSARKIAAEIGVGKDTVRRDLEAIRHEDSQAAPEPAATAPDDAPDGDRLVLVLDEPLRQALAVLRATRARPDTPQENVAAARAAIRATADTIVETQHYRRVGSL
ncbi:HTH domain-containing protein [Streptomyces sp. JB150]|uniref:HTH domain-containing protein n=1 Tax=Streptomyces sp. JB150 TaxID=2714844 RepID=UPI00140A3F46|nr:HTH domain-containing protein [Streptomyces sp. JB150]QIJ62569.1 HTH domain-containing protein [Streptomyces sp. JB150]